MKKLSFVTILLASVLAYGSNYFVEPTGAFVMPSDSGLSYHGMNGTVQYKDGYSVGLNAGRYYGPFKLYLSYSYTQFYAKEINFQTPIGRQSTADTDLYHSHALMFNCQYNFLRWKKTDFFIAGGLGFGFDGNTSAIFEGSAGISQRLDGFNLSVAYSYRLIQGQIIQGSTKIDEPNQSRIMLSIGRRF